ncbi:LCP family protein [Candidatus Saccharibacteria bacterium]|nr:LCP family protein [Candidatus Saccharibacteria bacterium]
MPKRKIPKSTSAVQTGRALPNRVSSYSPSHRTSASAYPEPVLTSTKPRSIWKRLVVLLLAIIFGAIIVVGVWDARNISSAANKMFGSGNLFNLLNSSALKQTDNGRVNILLVGYSVDDPGHPGASLTDSIILLSLSTQSKTGYMLSIPRDLYVNIPGSGYAKINEAYNDGGISLLEQVVSKAFQTPINYYALINYASVRETVNALGGISLNIKSSDPRGLYDPNISPVDGGPLELANGQQTIDGQVALNLTRARGDAYNSYGFAQADFDRTQHQRQVLTAIKDKLNWKIVLNPRKNSQILNAAANNVKTDLSASEARPLFGLFNSIPSSNLQSLSLRDLNKVNYLRSYTTSYGQSALIPAAGINDYSQIVDALSPFNQ